MFTIKSSLYPSMTNTQVFEVEAQSQEEAAQKVADWHQAELEVLQDQGERRASVTYKKLRPFTQNSWMMGNTSHLLQVTSNPSGEYTKRIKL